MTMGCLRRRSTLTSDQEFEMRSQLFYWSRNLLIGRANLAQFAHQIWQELHAPSAVVTTFTISPGDGSCGQWYDPRHLWVATAA